MKNKAAAETCRPIGQAPRAMSSVNGGHRGGAFFARE